MTDGMPSQYPIVEGYRWVGNCYSCSSGEALKALSEVLEVSVEDLKVLPALDEVTNDQFYLVYRKI